MQHGRIVETGPWQQICEHPREPYTQQLLAATPELPRA
jgi:peptide/nickel transport system ATP-binding protein